MGGLLTDALKLHLNSVLRFASQFNLFYRIDHVGSGSDAEPFIYMLGVPAVWPRYTFSVSRHPLHVCCRIFPHSLDGLISTSEKISSHT